MASTITLAGPGSKPEGTGGTTPFTFTLTRDGDTSALSMVDWYIGPSQGQGQASSDDISGARSGTVYFAAGETEKTIVVNVVGDAVQELDETFSVNLSNFRNATAGGPLGVTATILNDDGATPPRTQLAWGNPAGGVSHSEGDSGLTPYVFQVNRTGDTTGTTTVDYRVSFENSNAADFSGPLSGTLTFAPGELTKELTVNVNGDVAQEPDEFFDVVLSNAPGASVPNPIRATIVNDDGAPPTARLSITGPGAHAEGTGGTTPFDFTVTRDGDVSGSTFVDYYLVGQTDASDFAGRTTGTVYFNPGETSKVIHLDVVGDSVREADETFFIGLSNPRGGVIDTQRAEAVILNDDSDTPPPSTLSWGTTAPAGISQNEGDSGTTNFTYVLNRSGDTNGTTTVDWTITGAIDANDISSPFHGTVTFAPGELTKEIVVAVNGDTVQEPDETFQIALSNSPGATLPGTINGKIINDDGGGATGPTLSIGEGGSKPEGNSGTTGYDFTVSRTGDASALTMVDWYVNYYTAGQASASDFTGPTSGTLYFNPGETEKVVHVNVVGDTTPEPNEAFSVGLSNARGGVIGIASGPAQILNDDGAMMS
jgi:hypothetical protein